MVINARAGVRVGPSVLSQPRIGNYPERGARMARREERAYREYVSDEQRSQPRGPQRGSRVGVEEGCPARELCDESLLRDTRSACTRSGAPASRPRPRAAQVATQARARCRSTTRAVEVRLKPRDRS